MKRTQSDFLKEIANEIDKLDVHVEVDNFVRELRGNKPPKNKKKLTDRLLKTINKK